jgi:hypothetical protein
MLKTFITFRSTLSNATRIQRGAAALLMAAIMFTLTLAMQPNTHAPASTPPARQAAPAASNPSVPAPIAGSAYDGSAYVEYLTGRAAAHSPAAHNPNVPVIGTGSAYDGGSYVTEPPVVRNPNMPVIGTGSAYDGQ